MSDDLFGFTIFCDDLRNEVDGKLSFIGSYHGIMFVWGTFPASVPKFAFGVTLFQHKERARTQERDIGVRIILPGETIETASYRLDISAQQTRQLGLTEDPFPIADDEAQPPLIRVQLQFMAVPLLLRQPGLIKARAIDGGRVIKLGALRVQPGTPSTQP